MVRKRGKRQLVTIVMAITFILTGRLAVAQQVEKITPNGTKFLLYAPPGYTPGGSYPMLIVLHGQGGMGDNINKLRQRDETPSMLIANDRWPSRYPFIIVSPQLKRDESVPDPADQKWPPEMVNEVVEQVQAQYAVDERRVYITGLSQGAHGSYDYAVAYPEKIAAAVLISGVPDSTVACRIKDIPLWVFHGSNDRLVPPVFASGLIRALNDCSPKGNYRPRLNWLYGRNHEGWNEIYNGSNGYEIYDWMLKFRKNDLSNTPPYVSAGKELTLVNRSQPIRLYGDYFDSDGTISQVAWRKVSGPAATLEDTHTNFLKLSNLSPGTYEFELAVTDNNGARATDRVKLNIVSGNGGLAVTEIVLMDGKYQDVAALREGYVVNPEDFFRSEINIRVKVSGSPGSVRYSINSNLNARTTDESPFVLAEPRWTVEQGNYVICATPFSGPEATGAEGISQCYQIVVSTTATQPPEEPEEPVDPEEPEEPVDPEEPEEPVDPEEPEEPVDPEEPEEPVDPEEPEEPVDPEEPEEPVDPEVPEEPVDPEEPEEPVDPEVPEEPVDPEEPEEPVDPEVPEEPVDPEEPEEPVEPEIPVITVGIEENEKPDISFYPNPATDFIHIQLKTGGPGLFYYVITNALGMQVAGGELAAAEMMSGSEIDIRQLPSGLYFLNLRTTGGRLQRKFVVDSGAPDYR